MFLNTFKDLKPEKNKQNVKHLVFLWFYLIFTFFNEVGIQIKISLFDYSLVALIIWKVCSKNVFLNNLFHPFSDHLIIIIIII